MFGKKIDGEEHEVRNIIRKTKKVAKMARFARNILVIMLMMAHLKPNTAYADPSLPITAKHGLYAIEVYPVRHRLVVKIQGQKIKEYAVAVGNPSTPTPVGEYQIVYKGKNWGHRLGRVGWD